MSSPAEWVCDECKQIVAEVDYHVTNTNLETGAVRWRRHKQCDDNVRRREYEQTGRITTWLMMASQLAVMRADRSTPADMRETAQVVDYDVDRAVKRLCEDVKRFCIEAWFGGVSSELRQAEHGLDARLVYPRSKRSMQAMIVDSPHRTLQAKFDHDDFTITGQEMAGRALVEMESKTGRITLIVAADEQHAGMGIQGIDGTEDECRRLINVTREYWRDLKFKPYKG